MRKIVRRTIVHNTEIMYNFAHMWENKNISRIVDRNEIGLGWLNAITEWSTDKTVFHNPHTHQHLELIFCMKGSLVYEIDGYGTVTMGSGTGMVIPPETKHVLKGEMDSPGERIGFHIVNPPSLRRKYAVFTQSDISSFYAAMLNAAARPFHVSGALLGSVKELVDIVRKTDLSSPELGILRALSCSILYHVADEIGKPPTPPKSHMMDEAIRFLENNCGKKIATNNLVSHMGYGRSQLYVLFKKHTGLTPNEYLVRFRIEKAQQLLTQNIPIDEVAKKVGFSSSRYFKKVFMKYTGQTP